MSSPEADDPSRDRRIAAVSTDFLRRRPRIVAPAMACLLGALVLARAPRAQVTAISIAFVIVLGWFVAERKIGSTRVFGARALLLSLLGTLAALSGLSFLTGALASPALPMLFAPVGVGFAAFGRGRSGTVIFCAFLFAICALFALSSHVFFPPLPLTVHRAVLVGSTFDAVLLLRVGIASLSDAHVRAAVSLARARDEVIVVSRARSEMLEELGAKVAHEVKNPLAAVRAIVELSLETADEKGKKRLGVAAAEVTRIEGILHDFLSLARPVAEIRRVETDVESLIRSLTVFFESRAEKSAITLQAKGGRLSWVLDAKSVKEALVNLLVNAFQATPANGAIEISWQSIDDMLVIAVTDSGAGMSAEKLATLGKPWVTGREHERGSGLGVSLARQVAEQHGGTLTYESDERMGTRAFFRIPRSNE